MNRRDFQASLFAVGAGLVAPNAAEACVLRRLRRLRCGRRARRPDGACPGGYAGEWEASYATEGYTGVCVIRLSGDNRIDSVTGSKYDAGGLRHSSWASVDGPHACDDGSRVRFPYVEWYPGARPDERGSMLLGFLGTEVQGWYRLDSSTGRDHSIRLMNRS